jgi:acetylornithine deacetylase
MTVASRPRLLDMNIAELTATLVAAGQPWCENSLDGPARPPEETRAAEIIAPYLEELGFTVDLIGRTPTRANLVARRTFGPGPTLLLNDHLDTYPAGPPSRWKVCADPYQAVLMSDRVYARGTSDTRGNLAALLRAAATVCTEPPSTGTLLVALTVDEERNGVEGALYLLEQADLRADASITVEPTGWPEGARGGIGIAIAHTGHALLDVHVRGRSSHIWRPDTGVNAAHGLLAALHTLRGDALPSGWGISVVGLGAGELGMAQFTPLVASARLAVVGLGPDVARAEVVARVHAAIQHALGPRLSGSSGADVEVDYVAGPTFVPGTAPVSEHSPVVLALQEAYREVAGEPARCYTKPAYCDTIRFRHAGIPAVTFGPGDDGWAVYDESIGVDRMDLAAAVLARAVRTFLGTGEPSP